MNNVDNWTILFSPNQKVYYYNILTNKSQWTNPKDEEIIKLYLPPLWKTEYSQTAEANYFYNKTTGKSQWTAPENIQLNLGKKKYKSQYKPTPLKDSGLPEDIINNLVDNRFSSLSWINREDTLNVPYEEFNESNIKDLSDYLIGLATYKYGMYDKEETWGENGYYGMFSIEGNKEVYFMSVLTILERDDNISSIIYIDNGSDRNKCLMFNVFWNKNTGSLDGIFYGSERKDTCSIYTKTGFNKPLKLGYEEKGIADKLMSLVDYMCLNMKLDYCTIDDASNMPMFDNKCMTPTGHLPYTPISMKAYLIFKRGYTYYNARGYMPSEKDFDFNVMLKKGNEILRQMHGMITNKVPDNFDSEKNCKIFEKLVKKNEYFLKNEARKVVKVYENSDMSTSALDVSDPNMPKFVMKPYMYNF
jgi:hypothetical protein